MIFAAAHRARLAGHQLGSKLGGCIGEPFLPQVQPAALRLQLVLPRVFVPAFDEVPALSQPPRTAGRRPAVPPPQLTSLRRSAASAAPDSNWSSSRPAVPVPSNSCTARFSSVSTSNRSSSCLPARLRCRARRSCSLSSSGRRASTTASSERSRPRSCAPPAPVPGAGTGCARGSAVLSCTQAELGQFDAVPGSHPSRVMADSAAAAALAPCQPQHPQPAAAPGGPRRRGDGRAGRRVLPAGLSLPPLPFCRTAAAWSFRCRSCRAASRSPSLRRSWLRDVAFAACCRKFRQAPRNSGLQPFEAAGSVLRRRDLGLRKLERCGLGLGAGGKDAKLPAQGRDVLLGRGGLPGQFLFERFKALGPEKFLQQVEAVGSLGPEEGGEIALRQHHHPGELLTVHAQQRHDLRAGLVIAGRLFHPGFRRPVHGAASWPAGW